MSRKLLLLMCFVFVIGLCVSAKAAMPCWEEQAKLLASDGHEYDMFGRSVSISGDYCIVGAPDANYFDDDGGSAHIFVNDGYNWIMQDKLVADDWQAEDRFGTSVSISGDYCIAGADGDDDNGPSSGSAYIFAHDGENWLQQAKLLPNDGGTGDRFGISVSIRGDYCVVGAWGDDDNGSGSGSAYIFVRDAENWLQQAKLTASDGQEYDLFGFSASISDDFCIVGAYADDDNGQYSGSAYIFVRDGDNWLQQAKLLPSDGEEWEFFGRSVSISGDYCIVGARNSSYIFKRDGDNWLPQTILLPAWSVSINGDYCIVGNGYDFGSAYIFVRDAENWVQLAKLTASDGQEGDSFGCSVSISNDYCIVGAYEDDDNGWDSGSAYVFENVCVSQIEADLKLAPKPFSCDKPFGGPNKNAWLILNLVLPEGFLPEDVDTTIPAIFTPGEVESAYIETSINDDGRVVVETVFEHDEICDVLPPAPGGLLEITVTGLLTDGRYFYGTATMKVMQ